MRFKSESVTTLDRIKRDVRVANKIFMDNAPDRTGYNTEMQRVESLARMEFQNTEPYSPWQNKSESYIKIIMGKSMIKRVQRNIPKRVWDFGIV